MTKTMTQAEIIREGVFVVKGLNGKLPPQVQQFFDNGDYTIQKKWKCQPRDPGRTQSP